MFLCGLHLLLRGGPVMGPLLFCAVLAVAVLIERTLTLNGVRADAPDPPTAGQLRRGLPVLDTIITVAPLLGLLGTVTGMIKAFAILDKPGVEGPAAITGGVAEALIATATGLGIAIVSLVGYNALSDRARRLLPVGSGMFGAGQWKPKKARIEIIPMIDTIFFLLVFFMIESLSMVQMQSHRVALPESRTARAKPGADVVVTLTGDGEYYVDRQRVPELSVREAVAARVAESPRSHGRHQLRQKPAHDPLRPRPGPGQAGQCGARHGRHRARRRAAPGGRAP